jgi:hypothetical protein
MIRRNGSTEPEILTMVRMTSAGLSLGAMRSAGSRAYAVHRGLCVLAPGRVAVPVMALLAMILGCGNPAMPCKSANATSPEHRTGTFMITESGSTRTGKLAVTIATDMLVDEGQPDSYELPFDYRCEAPAEGTMTFDDTGLVIRLSGGRDLDISYESGVPFNPGSIALGGLGFTGGGYSLDASGGIEHGNMTVVGHWKLNN